MKTVDLLRGQDRSEAGLLGRWHLFAGVYVGLAVTAGRFRGLFDPPPPLSLFQDRAIGIATVEAVDASVYFGRYVYALLLLFAACLTASLATLVLRRWMQRVGQGRLPDEIRLALVVLSSIGVGLFFLSLLGRDPGLTRVALLPGLLAATVLLWHRLREEVSSRLDHQDAPSLAAAHLVLEDRFFLVFAGFLPVPLLLFFGLVLLNLDITRPGIGAVLTFHLVLAVAILWAQISSLRRRLDGRKGLLTESRNPNARLLLAAVPASLIPLSVPLLNEAQYSLPGISAEALVLIFAGVALALSTLLLFFSPERWSRGASEAWARRYYFPLIVGSSALLRYYQPLVVYRALDYFHQGEQTLPTQQLWSFGRIPMLDLRLTHTFSDMFYEVLYTLAHGLNGVDILLFKQWLPEVFCSLLVFALVSRLVSPLYALVTALLTPLVSTASISYFYALAPALVLGWAVQSPRVGRLLLALITTLGLLLWRIDFGLAAFAATAGVFSLLVFRDGASTGRRLLKATGIFAAGLLSMLILVDLLWPGSLVERLGLLLDSYAIRPLVRTRLELFRQFGLRVMLQYAIFPAIGVAAVAVSCYRTLMDRSRFQGRHAALFFLAAFTLIISVRSMGRHAVVEGLNPYLFLFLLVLFPFLLLSRRESRNAPGPRLYAIGVVFLIPLLAMPPLGTSTWRQSSSTLLPNDPLLDLRTWVGNEQRATWETGKHEEVVAFLRDRLEDDETFFDLSHSTLLYLLADKVFPTYVIPNLSHTSETIQASVVGDLQELLDQGRLPWVVFKQDNIFWDSHDRVPNEVRSYRIAELIYEHFEPFARVGRYDVWRHRDLSFEQALAGDGKILPATLNKIPEEEAQLERHQVARAGLEDNGVDDDGVGDNGVDDNGIMAGEGREPEALERFQVLPEDIQALTPPGPQDRTTLRIRYRSREAGELRAIWSVSSGDQVFEVKSQSSFRRTNPGGPAFVDVVLAGLPDEARLTGLEVKAPRLSGFRPRSASFVQTPEWLVLIQSDQKRDNFDLKALPWVWGELDPLAAVERTEPLHVLQKDVVTLAATESLEWAIPPALDASQAGYLHLRLAPLCPTEGTPESLLQVRYGPSLDSSFRFRPITTGLDEGQVFPLPLAPEAILRSMVPIETGYGPAFSASGTDPFFHKALMLDDAPLAEEGSVHFLRFWYRSSKGGKLEIFFKFDRPRGSGFTGGKMIQTKLPPNTRWAKRVKMALPIPPAKVGARILDIRFDPPNTSDFQLLHAEIVRVEPEFQDHVIRVSTQRAWSKRAVHRIALDTMCTVRLGPVVLRSRD